MTEFRGQIFFNWPITRSACIQYVICLYMTTSFEGICTFPLVKAVILRTALGLLILPLSRVLYQLEHNHQMLLYPKNQSLVLFPYQRLSHSNLQIKS